MKTLGIPILIVITNLIIALSVASQASSGYFRGMEILLAFFIALIVFLISTVIFIIISFTRLKLKTKRTTNIIIALFFTVPVIIGGYFGAKIESPQYSVIKSFDCGQHRKIVLSTDSFWEGVPFLYYQIYIGEHIIVPRISFELPPEKSWWVGEYSELTYRLILSDDGQTAAVVLEEWPHTPIIIHDFETNESWPLREASYRQLHKRLEKSHPELGALAKITNNEYITTVNTLDLGHSQIDDSLLANVQGLRNIHTVYLNHSHVTDEGIKHVITLPNLDFLDLSHTTITDKGLNLLLTVKRKLPYRVIDIRGTQVTFHGVKKFRLALPNTYVHADYSKLSAIDKISHAEYLSDVESLDLGNSSINNNHLVKLQGLKNIDKLYLNHTLVTDDGLKYLRKIPNLRMLNLRGTAITDKGLIILQQMKQLEKLELDVRETFVTFQGVDDLDKALPDIDIRWDGNTSGDCP